jgi:Ca2+-binding EF-hand superfamily protein
MKTIMFLAAAATALIAAGAAEAQPGPSGDHQRGEDRNGGMRALMMLGAADYDGDNTVTRAEVERLQGEEFTFRDRNGDGYLDQGDASPMLQRLAAMRPDDADRGPRRRAGRRGMMERLDGDEDGRLSRAEFVDRELEGFTRLDANGDGAVGPEEIDAAIEAAQSRRGPRRGATPWWRD